MCLAIPACFPPFSMSVPASCWQPSLTPRAPCAPWPGSTDHLAEPWAVPLQEARLSTFLAADRNVTQMQDASTDTTEAFLSGAVSDLQGRLNIGNLFQGGRVQPLAQRQFG
ncbi:general secretion pathway protein GspK, partial [Verminephrobacter sp. Larva24]